MIAVPSLFLISSYLSAISAWGVHPTPPHIVFQDLGDCDDTAGLTTWDRTIALNTICTIWTGEFLDALMVHEIGHLLCLCADHSLDPSSIMNPIVVVGNQIMEEDRWRVDPH